MQHIPLHWCRITFLLLYTDAVMRDLTMEQHCTWNGLALNCHTELTQHQTQSSTREDAQHALHCLCLVSESFSYPVMSACHNLRSHPPLKTVLNKLGDSYQTNVNTYKTHAMATCHRGARQPLDRDTTPHGQDTDIPKQLPS